MSDYDDPGWPIFMILWPIGPWIGAWRIKRDGMARRGGQLFIQRAIFIGHFGAVVTFWVYLSFIEPWRGERPAGTFAAFVALAGIASLGGVRWVRNRELELSSPLRLRGSYSAHTILGIGLALLPMLIAFAGVLVIGSRWVYLIGMAFGLTGLALVAPSRHNIDRLQERISASGSPLSLGRALTEPPPSAGTE